MGKRRNTAKTGDKALYNSREQLGSKKKDNSNDDDPMYDEIDQFHNDKNKEFLRLDGGGQSDEDDDDEDRDDGISRQEAIMDLGATMDDDDDESSSSEDDSDPSNKQDDDNHDDDDEVSLSSDDSSVGETRKEYQMGDPRNWGKKKGAYYHGDTADLEIGQNEEDAFLEEEAAKEVQAARLKEMREDDFMLSGDEDEQEEDVDRNASSDKKKKKKNGKSDSKLDDTTARESLTAARDLSKLTMKAKRKLLRTQHPELLPITSYFGDIVKDLKDNTRVATKALMEGEEGTAEAVGATRSGQEYLLTKALLQSSMALNVTMYLLLKGEEQQQMEGASSKDFAMGDNGTTSMIQGHPVMARLEQWNSMSQKLEDRIENKVEGLPDQIRNLVKAAALMKSEQDDSDDDGSSSEGGESEEQPQSSTHQVNDSDENKQAASETSDSSSSDEENNDEEEVSRQVLNEAKFGLRPNEVQTSGKKKSRKKRRNNLSLEDFGDHDVDDPVKISKSFASSINAIEQRSKTRNRRAAPMAEQLDEPDEDDQLRRGLQMMEEELGRLEGGGDEDEGGMDFEGESDKEIDDELEGDDFYTKIASRSKAKKAYKKSLYKVAPKFPSIDMEVQGERAISQTIQKNRGLVPHKAKINRNPRVKKREQYRKALIRRRGAVREIRTEEGHKYGGETTGIKSGLSRSRKL